jgi:uncharacterized protein (TIGR02246 family)
MKTTLLAWLVVLLAASSPCLFAADDPPRTRDEPGGARPAAASGLPPGAQTGEEKEIQAANEAFAQAFLKGDAKAIAELFTEDGEAVAPEGETVQGRGAIEEHYAARFAEGPGSKIVTTTDAIKFLAPGVARESGHTQVTPSDGGTSVNGRYTAIHVKRDGRWLLASVRELPDQAISHYEHLKELEWLLGDWVEESEDALVLTSVAWADDKNFLLRSFDVRVNGKPALTGTQRIGWDPLTRQIKSWVFDSQGGYGEGLWMRGGDQWAIKATGVRPDGRVATATQVLTYINKDTLRWKSIDRTLGSEIEQNIDEIIMVRKPPQAR